ncbi:monooxygenase [Periconia macrospinosa]|uniref:Monooxygenase n=1 Tax=Periconia macrospinosa TaxID=97972 RepID=A0A2V1ECK7_9PLEO|nr:monooxygenase [Periconia macrospinosa]
MQSPNNLKIAIIGAGPASLTLAAILHHQNLPFTIFEAHTSLRNEGGSLDLHPATGQAALKEAGLWAQFVKHARPESDVAKAVDLITGEVYFDQNGPDKEETEGKSEEELFAGRPEIDRGALSKILYESLPEASVKWGKKLVKIEPSATAVKGKHDLYFADGTEERGVDLVVGADGAWSKVRSLLSTIQPQYSGISLIESWHRDVKSNPWLHDYVGAGTMFAFGQDCAVISQRQGDGSVRTYACLRTPEDFIQTCGIDWQDQDTARKDFVEQYLSHISEDLKWVVLECKDFSIPRSLYELPPTFTFSHREGVTLIGDAAHLMTPFAGIGVNVGMTDSLSLARQIITASKGEKTPDDALREYEADLFPRVEKAMQKTLHGKETHFTENGTKKMVDMMKGH